MDDRKAIKEYRLAFEDETFLISFVTGPEGLKRPRACSAEGISTGHIEILAWKKHPLSEASLQLPPGNARIYLVRKDFDEALERFSEMIKPDTIATAYVRRSKIAHELQNVIMYLDSTLRMTPSDAELEAFLAGELKPKVYDDPDLGTFTLDRQFHIFQKEVDWLGTPIEVEFDEDDPKVMAQSIAMLRSILDNKKEWDAKLRNYMVDDLLEHKNEEWLADDEEPLTREEFCRRLSLESVVVNPDQTVSFWFDDGDIYCGHSLLVHMKDGELSEIDLYG